MTTPIGTEEAPILILLGEMKAGLDNILRSLDRQDKRIDDVEATLTTRLAAAEARLAKTEGILAKASTVAFVLGLVGAFASEKVMPLISFILPGL